MPKDLPGCDFIFLFSAAHSFCNMIALSVTSTEMLAGLYEY